MRISRFFRFIGHAHAHARTIQLGACVRACVRARASTAIAQCDNYAVFLSVG